MPATRRKHSTHHIFISGLTVDAEQAQLAAIYQLSRINIYIDQNIYLFWGKRLPWNINDAETCISSFLENFYVIAKINIARR
ncbi:MAG: hypothetical protein PHQ41_06115 [Candidatus Cloacimonetes bacterium]|nr:hypothetical protein [Candidatus Cloacimonadota bacterium]